MAGSDSSARWASEAFDFVRLNHRVGTRIYGLLILELGWLLIVTLTTKLFPEGQPYLVEFPWVSIGAGRNIALTWQAIELVRIYIVGALLVMALWFYKSGLFVFLTRPPVALLRVVLPVIFLAATAIFWIILLPVWLISRLIEIPLYLNWKLRQKREDLEKWKKEKGGVRGHARRELVFSADRVVKIGTSTTGYLLTYLFPYIYWVSISFARISTFSSDEELLAPKVALQAFSEAWVRLYTELRRAGRTFDVRLRYLPPSLEISSPRNAQIIRSILGDDALLWGSYTTTNPPMLWLNITTPIPVSSETDDHKRVMPESAPINEDILWSGRETHYPAIVVAQGSSAEAYIAFLIAVREAALNKVRNKFSVISIWGRMRETNISKFILSAIDTEIIRYLPRVAAELDMTDPEPQARRIALEVAVDWVKRQFKERDLGLDDDIVVSTERLRLVLESCIALAPSYSIPFYLQAMCYFVERNPDAALSAFKRGWDADRFRFRYSGTWAEVYFERAFTSAERDSRSRSLELAKAALYAMFAVEVGASRELKDTVLKSTSYITFSTLKQLPDDVTERFIYQLLDIQVTGT